MPKSDQSIYMATKMGRGAQVFVGTEDLQALGTLPLTLRRLLQTAEPIDTGAVVALAKLVSAVPAVAHLFSIALDKLSEALRRELSSATANT